VIGRRCMHAMWVGVRMGGVGVGVGGGEWVWVSARIGVPGCG